jgi:hypothetical protein
VKAGKDTEFIDGRFVVTGKSVADLKNKIWVARLLYASDRSLTIIAPTFKS